MLDTNVLSELLRPVPAPQVLAWFDGRSRDALFTTVISQGEMLLGVYRLPAGQRRERLQREVEAIFSSDLADRVFSYDSAAADAYAEIAVARRAQGRPMGQSDAMIAGISRSRGAALATRNVKDFHDCGIEVIDPWAT